MAEAEITVSILSWMLEDRLIKTLIQLPRTTSMPLNLCLHVQGKEQIPKGKRQAILDASSSFMIRDIFFTEGNKYSAKPRAELLKRSAKTPFVFMTDNDMIFQEGSLDALLSYLKNNKSYGIVDLAHNYLKWHRRVNGTEVTCFPVSFDEPKFVDVDLIGAASMLIRSEIINNNDIIDTRYDLGTWDFDLCMNVVKSGWSIATLCDKRYIAINDKTYRTPRYLREKVHNHIRLKGLRLFKEKWGFDSEYYPNTQSTIAPSNSSHSTSPLIISRAIYSSMGTSDGIGILSEHRLELMQRYFINSLKNQTDPDFSICLVVGSEHNETVKQIKDLDWGDLNVTFLYTSGDMTLWKSSVAQSKNYGREIDDGCPEFITRASNHPKSDIMARLDTDDWVAPGWIAHIKHTDASIKSTHFLINYQVIGQASDGRLYHFFAHHNRERTSPFIVLIQRKEPRISPYDDLHLRMGSKFAEVYSVPPSYVFMVVHGKNRSNRLYSGDKFIDGYTDYKSIRTGLQKLKYLHQDKKVKNSSIYSWKDRIKSNQDRLMTKQSKGDQL